MTTTQRKPKTLQGAGFTYDTMVGDRGGWTRRSMVEGVEVDDLIFHDDMFAVAQGYFWYRVRVEDGSDVDWRWYLTRGEAVAFALSVLDTPTVTGQGAESATNGATNGAPDADEAMAAFDPFVRPEFGEWYAVRDEDRVTVALFRSFGKAVAACEDMWTVRPVRLTGTISTVTEGATDAR